MSSDESEDFKSDVRLHFRHRDFDPLRQFEGRSSLQTYLTVVISRLLLDHRNGLSGRWRTSTEAKRLGPSAIPIERLVAHDAWTSDLLWRCSGSITGDTWGSAASHSPLPGSPR